MKKIKLSYPRRRELLKTPFAPMSDDEFRESVLSKQAIPCQQGTTLFVSKWRDGPGLTADAFLAALHAQGSKLSARRFEGDVNIRFLRVKDPKAAGRAKGSASSRQQS